jgi:prephenate dehydrogenase
MIGGSLAAAWRAAGEVGAAVGFDTEPRALDAALARGIIDQCAGSAAEAVERADLVLVATPVGAMRQAFAAIAGCLPARAIVTDVGSTKGSVIADARAALGDAFARFVPAHPIAGTEHSGAKAAFPTLYEGRRVILTPSPQTAADAIGQATRLWEACGARVSTLSAERHDRIYAAISHFPHMLSAVYMASIAGRADAGEVTSHAGTGFRDVTRIAASSPEMWRDIGLANRDALLAELEAFRAPLDALERALREGDGQKLEALLAVAAWARRSWAAQRDDPGGVE